MKNGDVKYKEMFVKKMKQLAKGERSHKLQKPLKGCESIICEYRCLNTICMSVYRKIYWFVYLLASLYSRWILPREQRRRLSNPLDRGRWSYRRVVHCQAQGKSIVTTLSQCKNLVSLLSPQPTIKLSYYHSSQPLINNHRVSHDLLNSSTMPRTVPPDNKCLRISSMSLMLIRLPLVPREKYYLMLWAMYRWSYMTSILKHWWYCYIILDTSDELDRRRTESSRSQGYCITSG